MEYRLPFPPVWLAEDFVDAITCIKNSYIHVCFNCLAFSKCEKGKNKTDNISDQWFSKWPVGPCDFQKNPK